MRVSQVKELTRIKQQILAFLLRKDIKYPDKPGWSYKFENCQATVEIDNHRDRAMLHRYLNHYNYQKRFVQIEAKSSGRRCCIIMTANADDDN